MNMKEHFKNLIWDKNGWEESFGNLVATMVPWFHIDQVGQ
jgi:hypothetical protein